MRSRSFLLLALTTAILFADSGHTFADLDPEALKRLDQVADAYKALNHYSDQGSFTRVVRFGEKERSEKTPVAIAFERPNLLLLDAGEVTVFADGKTLTTVLHPTKRYFSGPSPAALSVSPIADGPAGALLLGGAAGPPSQIMLKLLLGAGGSPALPDRSSGLKADKPRLWEDVTYDCLLVEQADEPPLRLFIDPKTNLIRRMEYVFDNAALSSRVPSNQKLSEMSLAWTSGAISTQAAEKSFFGFRAPEGYVKIEPAKPKVTAAAVNPMVGKPSPEFTLTVLDGPGKTKNVTLADLKGKVVVLDFWATWCQPCLLELPEIQALAGDLAKTKAEVVIVAVSQDRVPEDGTTARALVETLLKMKNLDLASGPVTTVALDPTQEIGEAFGVEALPTIAVIDAQGWYDLSMWGMRRV